MKIKFAIPILVFLSACSSETDDTSAPCYFSQRESNRSIPPENIIKDGEQRKEIPKFSTSWEWGSEKKKEPLGKENRDEMDRYSPKPPSE